MLESIEYRLKGRPKRISWPTSAFAVSLLFSFFLSGPVECKLSFEYAYAEQNLIKKIIVRYLVFFGDSDLKWPALFQLFRLLSEMLRGAVTEECSIDFIDYKL